MGVEFYMNKSEITVIEIGLINACNLKCSICSREDDSVKAMKKGVSIDFMALTKFLDEFKNLGVIELVGTISEPVMYPKLLELVKYLKHRNITIFISTNGNAKKKDFWQNLGDELGPGDVVKFGIDGSTQDIYEKYRVGGNLERVLENHRSFKVNSGESKSILQYIEFQHNINDGAGIRRLFLAEDFDFLEVIPSSEAFVDGSMSKPTKGIQMRYNIVNKSILAGTGGEIQCMSLKDKSLYINHMGQVSACCDRDVDTYDNKEYISIYNSGIDDIMAVVNNQIGERNENEDCISACSKICYDMQKTIRDNMVDNDGNVVNLRNETGQMSMW